MKTFLRKGVAIALGMMLVLTTAAVSFAYSTPTNVATKTGNKATISVGKQYAQDKGQGLVAPARPADFQFKIEAVEGYNTDTGTAIAKANMPLAAGETKTISYSATDLAANPYAPTKGTSFSQMTFTEPGWYMYRVNEVIPSTKVAGVSYDDSYYYVVVYVAHSVNASNLTSNDVYVKEVTSWHNRSGENARPNLTDIANVTDNGGNEAASNVNGVTFGKVNYTKFVNMDSNKYLSISKEVYGALGSMDRNFEFTVAFEGLGANNTFKYTKGTTEKSFTSNASGTASETIYLKSGETVTFPSLPLNTKYTVTEAANDHKASLKITANGTSPTIATGNGTGEKGNPAANAALATSQETLDNADGDGNNVVFKNTREIAPITGIPAVDMTIFGLAALVVIGFIAMTIARRKRMTDLYDAE